MSQRLCTTALAAASCVLVAACAGTPTVYTHPASNVADMRTIAVLPFDNMANADRGAADRIHQLMLAEMQAGGAFEVVEPGLVAQAVRSRSGALSALPPEDLKEIGQSLHADCVLIGMVLSYTDFRGADGGEATIQLRLVDTRSGGTVWSASHSRKGTTFTKRLFGLASDSGAEVARAVIRSELATLPR
jgi:TolB-like protein